MPFCDLELASVASSSVDRFRISAAALALGLLLCAAPARASDAAVGLAPVGIIVPIAAVGGLLTTIILGIDISDGAPVHPTLRNVSLAFAGINVLMGSGGLIAGALIEDNDLRPVFYGAGGGVLAIGLTGGVFGLVVDTYESDPTVALQVTPTLGGASWAFSGSF
ncbi:MAG: hypothetical protein DRI90_05780 [Deltaproteobacteria bacterium]|nr:MAG: hypothetical protein DRI90_05780 [Deltaproteobacteria bacterium]